VRVAVVSEFYPRAHDPVLGVWAHRQALAARDAGADVRVLVLHRVVPASAEPHKLRGLATLLRQPRRATLDGLAVEYVPFVSPPRSRSYGSWGSWAAPTLNRALRKLRREWPFELIHAHNAVPAGDALRDADVPLVVSVHGGDVFFTAPRFGDERIRTVFERAALVLANSEGVRRMIPTRNTRVVHLGTDVPEPEPRHEPDTLVTVGHLVARKRHDEVIEALRELPGRRYVIVGDGPERGRLERLARELGVAVEFTGQLPHAQALARARRCATFVMPSTDEAFGVAYVEAMAGGLPAIGRAGEPGPEEIAALGAGMHLTTGDDLAETIRNAGDGAAARRTAERHFTWEACGAATLRAYEDALR
jgi:teichuronic acid biosynthesis glycosyltransferase TuaC